MTTHPLSEIIELHSDDGQWEVGVIEEIKEKGEKIVRLFNGKKVIVSNHPTEKDKVTVTEIS